MGGPSIIEILLPSGNRVRRYTGEFWTSRQRQGGAIHEVSYRACFKPQLPRFFIERFTRPGDLVFDPFTGRGTTLVEAALLGRAVAGNDVNPLSRILTEPRLSPPTLDQVRDRLRRIPWNPNVRADIDLSMFYSPSTEGHIVSLRSYLRDQAESGGEDAVDRWLRMVATNRLTGHSSGFFSIYTLPPNQAVSGESQRKINEKRNQTPPDRDVAGLILRKTASLLRGLTTVDRTRLTRAGATAIWLRDDARRLLCLPDDSVDLVVTSPPFLNVVQYSLDNWLRCWFNCIDGDAVGEQITTESTLEGWSSFMREVLRELSRTVRPEGWIAFEVGEVRKGTLRLDETICPLGEEVGLQCKTILINQQTFTKTSNCWGVDNNRLGTNSNRIVVFQKPRP